MIYHVIPIYEENIPLKKYLSSLNCTVIFLQCCLLELRNVTKSALLTSPHYEQGHVQVGSLWWH